MSRKYGSMVDRSVLHEQMTAAEIDGLKAFYGRTLADINSAETALFLYRRGVLFLPGGRRCGWEAPVFGPEDLDGSV